MKYQESFNRVVEVHTPAVDRLITRHLFGDYPNSRQPLAADEKKSLAEMGIRLAGRLQFSHAEVLTAAQQVRFSADRDRVCNAFVLSLDSEFARFRAPLRALSLTSNVSRHRYSPWRPQTNPTPCAMCGCDRLTKADPVAAAHFMVRQGDCGTDSSLVEAAWCLNWFRHADFPKLTSNHLQRFHMLLKIFDEAPPASTSVKVASLLGSVLGGNKYARNSFMETLGLAGVLNVDRFPGLLQEWTPWDKRPQTREMIAPASLWRRRNGLNPDVFRALFPSIALPKGLSSAQPVG